MTRFYNNAIQLDDVRRHVQSRGTLPRVGYAYPISASFHFMQGAFSYCDFPYLVPFSIKRDALHDEAQEQMADEAHGAETQGPHVRSNLTLKVDCYPCLPV